MKRTWESYVGNLLGIIFAPILILTYYYPMNSSVRTSIKWYTEEYILERDFK